MKKFLTFVASLAVVLGAVSVFALPPGIGPGGGGPIGPSSGGSAFSGGTVTSPVLGPNGTAAAPTFGFSGDAGNGMYLKGADDLAWSTGGTERCDLSTTTFTCSSFTGALTGNASTATALAADPSDCTLPNVALGVTANGSATCGQPSNVTGNAATATALAADPSDCTLPNVALGVTANGSATCGQPSNVTGNAATASALAADPTDCAAGSFANAIAANGNLTCSDIASTYLLLAGGTMTGNLLFTDNTYDIGASGATRPRTGYFGTDVNVGGDVNITDDLTCNQATMTTTALAATTANGVIVRNTSVATTAVPVQVSPALYLEGHAHDTDTADLSDIHTVREVLTPASAAVTTSSLGWYFGKGANEAAPTYGSAMMTLSSAGVLAVTNDLSAQAGRIVLDSSTLLGSSTYGVRASAASAIPIHLSGSDTNAADSWGVTIANSVSLTAEGSRIIRGGTAAAEKFSVDKDGVYHQGYASGQVTDAVPSLTLTLVTAMDDDTIYDVTVGCQYIGYASGAVGTPTYHFSSVIGASFIRIDGVASEVGANTTISHKEDASAACVPCAVSFTNGATDTINATFTQCHLDADVANVKAWIKSMTKTNITTFVGVNQPAAN